MEKSLLTIFHFAKPKHGYGLAYIFNCLCGHHDGVSIPSERTSHFGGSLKAIGIQYKLMAKDVVFYRKVQNRTSPRGDTCPQC